MVWLSCECGTVGLVSTMIAGAVVEVDVAIAVAAVRSLASVAESSPPAVIAATRTITRITIAAPAGTHRRHG